MGTEKYTEKLSTARDKNIRNLAKIIWTILAITGQFSTWLIEHLTESRNPIICFSAQPMGHAARSQMAVSLASIACSQFPRQLENLLLLASAKLSQQFW
jgi:hypothetical protein